MTWSAKASSFFFQVISKINYETLAHFLFLHNPQAIIHFPSEFIIHPVQREALCEENISP